MKNLINRWVRSAETYPTIPELSRIHLVRTFVETGDERCPIAGIWSRMENDAIADEAELPWPAMQRILRWRAFLFASHKAALP